MERVFEVEFYVPLRVSPLSFFDGLGDRDFVIGFRGVVPTFFLFS